MAITTSVTKAKNEFAKLLGQVIHHYERVIVTKRGKPVGVIISIHDLEQREDLENREILRRIRAIRKRTKKFIPFDQVVRDYEKKWGVDLKQVEPEEF